MSASLVGSEMCIRDRRALRACSCADSARCSRVLYAVNLGDHRSSCYGIIILVVECSRCTFLSEHGGSICLACG
eukprot:6386016-Alexandrium_andersonii.AAC.1